MDEAYQVVVIRTSSVVPYSQRPILFPSSLHSFDFTTYRTITMKHSRTRLKRYLKRPSKANKEINLPCSEVLPMHTLAGLPPELFLLISDFRSVVDITCLSLCNRRFRDLSLRQIIGQSPLTKHEKLSILNRLERDSPEYFACDICHVLHRYDGSESFGLSEMHQERTCRLPCVDEWFTHSSWILVSTGVVDFLSFSLNLLWGGFISVQGRD